MSKLQKTLDALQPYVVSIRYVDGLPVVDTVFKDGWTLPESNIINKVKGNEELNYYMLFSERDGIGLDEILEFVDATIKANVEREKKHELLKEKINELKDVFKKNSLNKLKNLKFVIGEEDLMPELNDLTLDEPEKEEISNVTLPTTPTVEIQETYQPPTIEENLTDEEREILEEEKRAENFKRMQQANKKNNQLDNIKKKVELPPKKLTEVEVLDTKQTCECGPNEACNICIEYKDL